MARSSQRSSILIIAFLALCGVLGMLFAQKTTVVPHDSDSDVSDSLKQFTDEVPVVFIDGRKAFKYRMDEQEFLRKLAS